jgi:DNA-binding transcriptional LysR family regulator
MELRHLRTFLALAEELHFGRTAARLHVAQSAVSQTIRALEEELGVPLFVRSKRQVTLAPAGHAFVDNARGVLAELERGAQAARAAGSGETGQLVIGLSLAAALTAVPRLIARFRERHPAVEVRIEPSSSVEQLAMLRSGRCDVGFMPLNPELSGFETRIVELAPLMVLAPNGHPLARKKSLPLTALADQPLIFLRRTAEPRTYAAFERRCMAAGFVPRIVVEAGQVEILLGLVAAGVGLSVVPRFIASMRFPGVVAVPLVPAGKGGIIAVWHPPTISPPGRRFVSVLPEPPPL